MPITIAADRLESLIAHIFTHTECDPAEAALLSHYLVEADLAGHDSHGVMRTYRYVLALEAGAMKAGRKIKVVRENPAFAVLDGQAGIGHSLAKQAVEFGLDRAATNGCFIVALRNAGHVGRVGSWAQIAAEAGLVSIHFVNARGSVLVAPYGGVEKRFSTAPFCAGVPRPNLPPVILDFATSVVAEGKVMVAAKGGKPLPDGSLIESDGSQSNDPVTLYGAAGPEAPPDQRNGTGAIRAFGDHKGSGLALMCELLGGALTGNRTTREGRPFANGMLSIYLSVDAFDDGDGFAAEVADYIKYVTDSKPVDPDNPIQIPGDPERATAAQRLKSGITIPDETWRTIQESANKVGISSADFRSVAGL